MMTRNKMVKPGYSDMDDGRAEMVRTGREDGAKSKGSKISGAVPNRGGGGSSMKNVMGSGTCKDADHKHTMGRH